MRAYFFLSAGLGLAVAQLISLAFLPFLSRSYTPSEFAPWALSAAFVLFVGAMASLRYDLAIVVEREPSDASALFWLVLLSSLIVTCVAFGCMEFAAYRGWLFAGGELAEVRYCIGAWLLLLVLTQVFNAWHLHHGAFLVVSLSQIASAGVMNIVQLLGAFADPGNSAWLVFGSLAGQGAAFLVVLASVGRRDMRPLGLASALPRMGDLAWKHRRFVQYTLPFTFFNAIRERVPVFLVGYLSTSHDSGLYSQAWRLSNVPAGVCGGALRPVLFHAAAEHGIGTLEGTVNRILLVLTVLGVPALAILSSRPETVFGWVLGESWRDTGPYAAALAFPALAFSMSSWMDRLLDAEGKQHFNLWSEVFAGLSSTLVLWLFYSSGAGLLWAVAAQSAVLTFSYMAVMAMTYKVGGFRYSFLLWLLLFAVCLFAAVSMLLRAL